MLKIIVNGAFGKMGQMAVEAINQQQDMELVAELGREDDLGNHIQQQQADIVVDVTSADSVYKNCQTIIANQAHPVIGTSGLTDNQIQTLQQQCQQRQLGGVIAPNFSIGAVMMMHCSQLAAQFMERAEILEAHHMHKKDAPSSTALKTAQLLSQKLKNSDHQSQESWPGALGADYHGIPIHAVRSPGVLAEQNVYLANPDEQLNIQHRALSRQCFRPGLLTCCRKAPMLTSLIYGLDQLLLCD